MPRKPRIISSSGIYHVVLRSVNQHIIFEENSDYSKFLLMLSDCRTKYDIDIYAYCLMDNHIHLLINAKPEILSTFFRSLGTRFARWYNNKYHRCGHLFQDRFFSKSVETDASFFSTLKYIHNNPVKANICIHPSEYRWSSFTAYYGAKNALVNVDFAISAAGTKEALQNIFAHGDEDADDESFADIHREARYTLSDEAALDVFKTVTRLKSASETSMLNRKERNKYIRILKDNGLNVNQIARIMDVSRATVFRICNQK